MHWLKTDFDKWRDEDDSDVDEKDDRNFEDVSYWPWYLKLEIEIQNDIYVNGVKTKSLEKYFTVLINKNMR